MDLDVNEQTVTYLIDLSNGDGEEVYDNWHVTNYDGAGREFKSNIDVLNFFAEFPQGIIMEIYAESY